MAATGAPVKPVEYCVRPMIRWPRPSQCTPVIQGARLPALAPCGRLLALWLLGCGGCRLWTGGLQDGAFDTVDSADAPGPVEAGSADGAASSVPDAPAPRPSRPEVDGGELASVSGPPQDIGCADGTREGFTDVTAWPGIAGCSGAWNMPGLLGESRREPRCARRAGNTGRNPFGLECTVADICAEKWHVCQDSLDVAQHSPTDCEGAAPAGSEIFFLVQSGASPLGVCSPDPGAANDLHGCGTLGQPEAQTCEPLERRMGFADCLATGGLWACGGAADHLNEANLVIKRGIAQGGVLCCRD